MEVTRHLKILHIIVGLEIGGAEMMLSRLVGSPSDHADQIHAVVSLTSIGAVGVQLRDRGITVLELRMFSFLSMVSAVVKLVRLIRRTQPDIVQTWMYHADFLGGLAAWLSGHRAVIWGIRTTDVSAGGTLATSVVRKFCAILSYKIPTLIVCAADASRKAHIALGYDASKMVTVPNGFDFSRLRASASDRNVLRLQCGVEADEVVIGYLGRFHLAKDQENFVKAAGLVAQRHTKVKFLMVGRDLDASNVRLNQWVHDTGAAHRFVFLGERNDVARCLHAMDIFCLSSRTEGFPNVVAEAMYAKLPCVVTDVGDAAILVGDTGLVVPKEDARALAAGLMTTLEKTTGERLALGTRAHARVTAEYSIHRARERFTTVYHQVIQKESA